MDNHNTLNILYQSNDYYAPITGVSLTSLLMNNQEIEFINIYILNDDISKENIDKFHQICEEYHRDLLIIPTEEILAKLKELKVAPFKGTYTTYFKLFAINLLKLPTSNLLQLDGDTIVNQSLGQLLTIDISECLMTATYDCTLNRYKKWINIPLNDDYYNCGVLFINRDNWIEYGCEEIIVNHLKNVRSGYYTVDQDIINVLFRKNIKYLDIKYNFNSGFYIYGIRESLKMYGLRASSFTSYHEINEAYQDPVIYHCMGAMTGRPWERDSIHPQNQLFNQYLKLSPWKDFQKVQVHRIFIFKIQRLLYLNLPRQVYLYIHTFMQTIYLYKKNWDAKTWSTRRNTK